MTKLKLTIIILISVLLVGGTVISLGFLTSQEYISVPEISNQYEKLEIYKNELEKLNQQNQQILDDLEMQLSNTNGVNLDQIYEEIEVVKQVIEENKTELEQVIIKLSEMESSP